MFFKCVVIATKGLSMGAQAAGAASESIGRVSILGDLVCTTGEA